MENGNYLERIEIMQMFLSDNEEKIILKFLS